MALGGSWFIAVLPEVELQSRHTKEILLRLPNGCRQKMKMMFEIRVRAVYPIIFYARYYNCTHISSA